MSFKCTISPCKSCKVNDCCFKGQENDFEVCKGYTTTNGDMIMTMFNCMVIEISKGKVYVEGIFFPFDEEWWNAPYQPESEEIQ